MSVFSVIGSNLLGKATGLATGLGPWMYVIAATVLLSIGGYGGYKLGHLPVAGLEATVAAQNTQLKTLRDAASNQQAVAKQAVTQAGQNLVADAAHDKAVADGAIARYEQAHPQPTQGCIAVHVRKPVVSQPQIVVPRPTIPKVPAVREVPDPVPVTTDTIIYSILSQDAIDAMNTMIGDTP